MGEQTRAAVVVPFDRTTVPEQPRLGFVVRSSESTSHANDVGFPGGKHESADDSLRETARREAIEELALPGTDLRITDALDSHQTRSSGFDVQPFLGVVTTPNRFVPGSREITDTFWVKLSALRAAYEMDDDRIRYRLTDPTREIWGLTARIVTSVLVTETIPNVR